jgi:hypothetical protein
LGQCNALGLYVYSVRQLKRMFVDSCVWMWWQFMNTGDADMCGQWFVGYSLLVLSVIGQN